MNVFQPAGEISAVKGKNGETKIDQDGINLEWLVACCWRRDLRSSGMLRIAAEDWYVAEEGKVCFLGTFAKLRNATINFVMSVRPSVRMEQLGFPSTDFHWNWYLSDFRKSLENVQVLLKYDQNFEHFT